MHQQGLSTWIGARRPRALTTAGLVAVGTAIVTALAIGSPVAAAETSVTGQAAATPTPLRLTLATPTPFRSTTTTTTTTTAPRAGELPTDIALPLLVGGAAFLGGGTYLLRRKPRT